MDKILPVILIVIVIVVVALIFSMSPLEKIKVFAAVRTDYVMILLGMVLKDLYVHLNTQ